MRIRDLKILTACILAVSVAFLGLGWAMITVDDGDLSQRPFVKWQPPKGAQLATSKPPQFAFQFKEALTKPLFAFDRKPYEPKPPQEAIQNLPPPATPPQLPVTPSPPAPSPPPITPNFILKGLASIGGKKNALIANQVKPEGEWVAIGSVVDGWKLIQLGRNTADLILGEQKLTLSLYVDNISKPIGRP